jgi:hypothetical protein
MNYKKPSKTAIRKAIGYYLNHNAEGYEETFWDISKLWGLDQAIQFLEDATGQNVGKAEEYENYSDSWIANQIIARAEHIRDGKA